MSSHHSTSSVTAPPMPQSMEDVARWQHTGKLYRMMYGLWESDLCTRIALQMGNVRKEAQGKADLSANIYKAGWKAVSVMFDAPGKVSNPDTDGAVRMTCILLDMGYWSLMQTVQRDTLAMRELLVRVDVDRGDPTLRLVYPHYVTAKARPQRPSVPVHVEEARQRTIGGRLIWTWDVLDSEAGVYRVVDTDGMDVTREALAYDQEDETPNPYPYVKADGTKLLPYTMYHAEMTGKLWDAYSTTELYEGSLNLGVKYTFLGHIERKAAWAQRYAVGVQVAGVNQTGDGPGTRRATVVADPSTVLMLEATGDGVQPMVSQWNNPVDIAAASEAITRYERRLAAYIGLNAADITRSSGDPRSGYALAVNRDSQRNLQRRFEPVFSVADRNTITLIAVLLNRWHAGERTPGWVDLPEDGWSITYNGVPLSAAEKKAIQENNAARIAAGTLDIVSAYQAENPGTSRAEAVAALDRIRIINASFANAPEPSRIDELRIRDPSITDEAARRMVIESEVARLGLESQIAAVLKAAGFGAPPKSSVELAPTDLAAIVSVNEARAQEGLPPVTGGDVSVFAAKTAAQAEAQGAAVETTPPKEGTDGK